MCDDKFNKKDDFDNHILTVHEGKKPFECKFCNLKLTQKGTLNKHIATVHKKKNMS